MTKRKNHYLKVGIDMFTVQGGWTVWFLGIITIVHLVKALIAIKMGSSQEDFLVSSFVSSNMFLLVIGIIAVFGFLPFFVKNGITRKDFFKGSVLAAIGLALLLISYSLLITGIEYAIVHFTNIPLVIDNSTTGTFSQGEGDILIARIIKMVFVSPFIALDNNWFVSILLVGLNFISSYSFGMLIGSGYYRYGWVAGFGFIGISIVLMILWDLLWGSELGEPLSGLLGIKSLELPVIASAIGSVLIIAVILRLIRGLTSRVVIKL